MNDTQSKTESLLDVINAIANSSIMLPEFQRDFRWEVDKTYDLFDSLIRNIFVGTIIYGKPSFGMTLRAFDLRSRKGKGSNTRLETYDLSSQDIQMETQTNNLRIVLDGQQRLTSVYRAILGIDNVFLIIRSDIEIERIGTMSLEEMLDHVAGQESRDAVSVKLSDAYQAETNALEDDELTPLFGKSLFAQKTLTGVDEDQKRIYEKIYRRVIRRTIDLFKQQKMLSFYLLDMSLDKFCIFFERSNSRGIQLNFTDILAAKLYHGFNLRKKIEDFESQYQNQFVLNREIIIRAIAYIRGIERKETISIDKATILGKLDADDFNQYWEEATKLYIESLRYLISQHFILSQDWMPSENMIIPLMMFRRQLKSFDQMNEEQREFVEFWYWASIFSNRYSTASNEVIIGDSNALAQIARNEKISSRNYFSRLRSLIQEPDDLFSYTKRTSMIYRGVLTLLNYQAKGLPDWNSANRMDTSMRLEDHHIYPRAYINSKPNLDMENEEADQLVDCVVNRTLIPKLLNIKIGKNPPQAYLSELQQLNHKLSECLQRHLISDEILRDASWNESFKYFLTERSEAMFGLISQLIIEREKEMAAHFASQIDIVDRDISNLQNLRLKDMIEMNMIQVGERVYVRKQPNSFAIIVDGSTVEFEGKHISINSWGQQMTGWPSISIYDSVLLERTQKPLGQLRVIQTDTTE